MSGFNYTLNDIRNCDVIGPDLPIHTSFFVHGRGRHYPRVAE
jgi:hypothetical protein